MTKRKSSDILTFMDIIFFRKFQTSGHTRRRQVTYEGVKAIFSEKRMLSFEIKLLTRGEELYIFNGRRG